MRFVSWVVSLLLAFVVFLLSLFFVLRKKLGYISRIDEGVSILESGKLDHSIPVEGTDELARLALSINLMSRSVQARIHSEQKVLQANREIVSDLSHDIRTPLTVAMGYLNLLLEKEDLSDSERRDYLTLALKKAEQIKDRTEALLDFATLTSGQLPVSKVIVDARTMVDQLKAELSALAELRVGDDLPPGTMLSGDVGLLERLFDNLLSNLQQHGDMNEGIDFQVCLKGGEIRLEIENAVGKQSSAKSFSHSLGLKICSCILELHGGRFEVDGNGRNFRIRIALPAWAL
jgi:signal transduction histidine kinase